MRLSQLIFSTALCKFCWPSYDTLSVKIFRLLLLKFDDCSGDKSDKVLVEGE